MTGYLEKDLYRRNPAGAFVRVPGAEICDRVDDCCMISSDDLLEQSVSNPYYAKGTGQMVPIVFGGPREWPTPYSYLAVLDWSDVVPGNELPPENQDQENVHLVAMGDRPAKDGK